MTGRFNRTWILTIACGPLLAAVLASSVAGQESSPAVAQEKSFTPASNRVWIDSTGQHRITATLIRATQDAVLLLTDEGRQLTVPLAKLSAADREYLRGLTAAAHEPAKASETASEAATANNGLRYVQPMKLKVRMGVEVTAAHGPCNQLVVTFPLPMDWPEQRVAMVDRAVSPPTMRVVTRTLNDGVQQVEFTIPRLAAGESAHVIYTLEIERFQITAPPRPEELVFARRIGARLRPYLAESPFIETSHPKIKAAASELRLDAEQSAWHQVQTIYDWTRGHVQWDGTKPLKGALEALTSGNGDCEEITSLFVAMCRVKGVPARSVWVDGHAYPEFYLEDAAGNGLWIPSESLGARLFGSMNRYQLLLQKGDNFRMAQKSGPQRYVTPTLSGTVARGAGQPVLREIRENLATP
jgi:hypothetical protein